MPAAVTPDWESLCGEWAGDRPGTGFKVLSLYSGAGGLDRGFLDVGFKITHAVESDPHAADTYKANVGAHIAVGELPSAFRQLPSPAVLHPDVIIGGPPCQGFSVMGTMDPCDPRSRHVHVFLDGVRAYRPTAFCMENVKALATSERWRPVRDGLLARARKLGYRVEFAVLSAADYAVPQARERMFLIGIRDGYPLFPVPVTRAQPMTVLEALGRLPGYGQTGNDSLCTAKVVLAKKPVLRPSPYKGSLMFNGSGRPLDLDAVARTLPASMGGNGTPIVDQQELSVRLTDMDRSAESWVVLHHKRLLAGQRTQRRHPLRRITVEEAAALQAFPDDWEWRGPRNSRFRQIGNAVPPRLARYVALSLGQALQAREQPGQADPMPLPMRRPSAKPRSLLSGRWQAKAA